MNVSKVSSVLMAILLSAIVMGPVVMATGSIRRCRTAKSRFTPTGRLQPAVEVMAEGPRGLIPEVQVHANGPEYLLPVVEVTAPRPVTRIAETGSFEESEAIFN